MADCWVTHPDIVDQTEIHVNKYTDYSTVSSTGTLTANDKEQQMIRADSSGGDITITLPLASSMEKQIYEITKIVDANTVTIDGNGTETIDGALTQDLKKIYESFTLYSDGTEWFII